MQQSTPLNLSSGSNLYDTHVTEGEGVERVQEGHCRAKSTWYPKTHFVFSISLPLSRATCLKDHKTRSTNSDFERVENCLRAV